MASLYFFALINGLSMAMAVFLVASGLTLIYGILKIVNFAHGSFFMIGAYVAFSLTGSDPSIPVLLASAVAAGAVVAVLGFGSDLLVFRRLRAAEPVYSLIASFGVLLVCNGAVKLIWGLNIHSVNPPESIGGTVALGPLFVPQLALFTIAAGVVVYLALEFVIHRMWIGKIVSVVAYDRTMSSHLGLKVPLIFTAAIMVAFFLAGAAGGLLLPNQALSPALFDAYLMYAFIVVIIGGLGNIRGAFLASIILGIVDSLNVILLVDYAGFAVQVAMIVCLVWRPRGILSTSTGRDVDDGHASSLGAGVFRAPSWLKTALAAAAVATALSVPLLLDQGLVTLAGIILIEILLALSWNLLFGYTGLVSFGHAGFFMIGAYFVAFGLKNWVGLPFLLLLACSAAVGAALAFVIGVIALRRTGGVTFAVLTLVASQIAMLWVSSSPSLGSEDGIPAIPRPVIDLGLFSVDLAPEAHYYWFLCLVVLLVGAGLWMVCNNSFGRSLVAIRQDAERATFYGIEIHKGRVISFCLSGAVAALAGGLQAPWTQIVTPLVGSYTHSAYPMFATLLGGSQFFWGPALGAALFGVLEHVTRSFQGVSEVLTGLSLLLVVLAAPQGVMGALARLVGQFFTTTRATRVMLAPARREGG